MFKIANVFVDKHKQAKQCPTLYCHANAMFQPKKQVNEIKFYDAGTFDFTTYFNALSVKKWKNYTILSDFRLHLEIEGCKGSVTLTYADQFTRFEPNKFPEKVNFDATKKTCVLDLRFPECDADLLGFIIEASDKFTLKNSYYYSDADESSVSDVKLAICTTTFKKEEYILPNLEKLNEEIFANDDELSKNLWVHVVDNGRTIRKKDVPVNTHILLHPNDNVGGAGGFARGMIESLHQSEGITHVLLMDDDVSMCTESIRRTFNLLRVLKDAHKQAFIGGAMLEIDKPSLFFEDSAYVDGNGFFVQTKHPMEVDNIPNCVLCENHNLVKAGYAAWWYCVIPTDTIKREGLPLPIFVRCDDVEYGCRCKPEVITLNSLCVWHKGFRERYDAAVERYQTVRNALIANAITGLSEQKSFINLAENKFRLDTKQFNYKDAELICEALEDFLKGPEFIMEKGMAEAKFLEKHKTCELLKPLDEALLDVDEESRGFVKQGINYSEAYNTTGRGIKQKFFDVASWNGQTLTGNVGLPHRNWVVLPHDESLYMPEKTSGAEHIFVVDFFQKRGVVRHKDPEKFKELHERFKHDIKEIKGNRKLLKRYKKVRAEITGEEFWKDYLGI